MNTSLATSSLLAVVLFACNANDKPAGEPAQGSSPLDRPGIFTTPTASSAAIRVQPDSDRTAWAVLSSDGGTLTATAADGTRFVLTIPKRALLGPEEITLTPVASLAGLPAGASSLAGAQLGPDGLLLLEPATLEIVPPRPIDRQRGFPVAWSAGGEDLHLHPLMPRAGAIRFQVSHFSGFAIASGSDTAMNEILHTEPERCGERYFREIADALDTHRRAALMGEEGGISEVIDRFVAVSQRYFAEVIQPIASEVAKDDALLPCVMAELGAFDRSFRLLAGDSLAQSLFAKPLRDAWMEVSKASAVVFEHAAQRCKRNESPMFQLQLMASAARFLANAGLTELLPRGASVSLVECSQALEYRVDIDSTIDNTYRLQGRGSDFSSSRTTVKAKKLRIVYNDQRSKQSGTPTFMTLQKAPFEATVTAVARQQCPDRVRVMPGSNVEVTVTPILNPRVGKLSCSGGRVRCEPTDLTPGVMVQLSPNVVEETYVHTKTSSGCMDPGEWNEWMMFFEGSQSTGAFEPFQMRGDAPVVTIVRQGTGARGYVKLPDIERSISRTTVSATVVRD